MSLGVQHLLIGHGWSLPVNRLAGEAKMSAPLLSLLMPRLLATV